MSSPTTAMPNGHGILPPTTIASAHPSETAPIPPPPEIEATLSRLSAYRNVRGVMILSRGLPASIANRTAAPEANAGAGVGVGHGAWIIQSSGTAFEGENGKRYANSVESVVEGVAKAVGEWDDGDELKFMRIRTKRHELIITPDDKYLLVVLQDPGQ